MPKDPSPITELERMLEKRRTGQGTVKDLQTAPGDWLRKLPSAGEVRNGNGRKPHGNGSASV